MSVGAWLCSNDVCFCLQKKTSAVFEVAEVVPVMTNNYEESILKGAKVGRKKKKKILYMYMTSLSLSLSFSLSVYTRTHTHMYDMFVYVCMNRIK